jgi:uncharacterized membrane-anchored protein YitT (DUF2179 family)
MIQWIWALDKHDLSEVLKAILKQARSRTAAIASTHVCEASHALLKNAHDHYMNAHDHYTNAEKQKDLCIADYRQTTAHTAAFIASIIRISDPQTIPSHARRLHGKSTALRH